MAGGRGQEAGGRLLGKKKLRVSGKEPRSLPFWAHLQGHPETCPKEAVSTKGLLHRVFFFFSPDLGDVFAFSYLN